MSRAITTFAAILQLLGTPDIKSDLADGFTWMARAMEGEQGGVMKKSERYIIGWWIADVILNRLESPHFPANKDLPNDPEHIVRDGFYGWTKAQDPSQDFYMLAARAFVWHLLGNDQTKGCLFMYSYQDIEELGFDIDKAHRCFEGDDKRWGLCFYKEYPGQ